MKLKTAVVCPVKLENNYIREWVECYLNLGFDNVILMDNNELAGERLEDVIDDYIKSGFVIVENFRGQPQSKTNQNDMNQATWDKHNQNYDWLAYFDADEYLELDPKYKTISDFLSLDRFNDADEIRVSWKMYGDNGIVRSPILQDYRVEARFKDERNISPTTWHNVTKAILRGKRDITFNRICHACSHHGANISNIRKDVDVYGTEVDHTSHKWKAILAEAWLNHYRTKSLYEFLVNKAYKRTAENTDLPLSEYTLVNQWWRLDEIVSIVKNWGFNLK